VSVLGWVTAFVLCCLLIFSINMNVKEALTHVDQVSALYVEMNKLADACTEIAP
jgi:hypothetical protein